ncbi:NUDIX hydrolase [Rhodothermus profundi]|uniref:Predicted NTP pyrophosphohydrolase, NUDIX family n=1 Tax=Rhodothermus profundi TaxID=633813 RepID=A0A1M6PV65_9BACT|nr:NUDIX hydrolase [Rhodothermus profundi]SHK11808.1 Predicted NTP pyrophosphohydrolase, NUDIX family [Rhodothermus profundi]
MGKQKLQAGVLPVRFRNGQIEVLLITSRTVGRWVIPKGNVKRRQSPLEAARQEAYEEAGVRGRLHPEPLGRYLHGRPGDQRWVEVYLMTVAEELDDWPEQAERRRCWVPLEEARQLVYEEGLRRLLDRLPDEWERRRQGRLLTPQASRLLVLLFLLISLVLAFGGTYYLAHLLTQPEVQQRLQELQQGTPPSLSADSVRS